MINHRNVRVSPTSNEGTLPFDPLAEPRLINQS
jgi:hypothetical protein